MSKHVPTPANELEEAAQGHELFRAPGRDLMLDQAEDQAVASGWLPEDTVYHWPSPDATVQIVNRRKDLYAAMQGVEASAARASGTADWAQEVSAALANLEDALQRHITEIEGPGGLFAEITDRAPHLSSTIADLQAEHIELLSATRTAIGSLPHTPPGEVRRKLLGILGHLALHRQNGAELLFDAYNLDLAGGE